MPETAKVGARSNRGSKPGERRGGRVKGTPNKTTGQVKEMILQALDKAGGADYLYAQAAKNPTAFMTLIGKVLPLQLTGENGGPIQARVTLDVSKLSDTALREISGLNPDA